MQELDYFNEPSKVTVDVTKDELIQIAHFMPENLKPGTVGFAGGLACFLFHALNYISLLKRERKAEDDENELD